MFVECRKHIWKSNGKGPASLALQDLKTIFGMLSRHAALVTSRCHKMQRIGGADDLINKSEINHRDAVTTVCHY